MVYLQNRRYLPENQRELRNDESSFSIKAPEAHLAPSKKNYETSVEMRRSYETLRDEKSVKLSVKLVC